MMCASTSYKIVLIQARAFRAGPGSPNAAGSAGQALALQVLLQAEADRTLVQKLANHVSQVGGLASAQ